VNDLRRWTPMPRQATPLTRTQMAPSVTPLPRTRLATVTPITGRQRLAPVRQLRRNGASSGTRQDPRFPPDVHDAIVGRDRSCVLLAWSWPAGPVDCLGSLQAHHRELVGMGGTSDPRKHVAANGLGVCLSHHDWAHHNRIPAGHFGLIVDKGRDFRATPMSFDGGLTWWLFNKAADGYIESGPPVDDAA
jgi:hypothetical protein